MCLHHPNASCSELSLKKTQQPKKNIFFFKYKYSSAFIAATNLCVWCCCDSSVLKENESRKRWVCMVDWWKVRLTSGMLWEDMTPVILSIFLQFCIRITDFLGSSFFLIIFIYSIKKNNNKKKPDITHDDSQVSHNCCKLSPSVKSGHYTFSPSLRALVPLRRSPTASVYIIIFKSTTTPLACNLFIKSRSRQSRSTYSPPVRAHGLPRDAPHAESKRGKNERSAYLRDPKE